MSERTPKRRRRIGYQGKRLKPGSDGRPRSGLIRSASRRGWLGRAHGKPWLDSLNEIPGIGNISRILGTIRNRDKSREGMKPKRKG